MGQVLVGTASWTDKSLIEAGTFYPEKSMTAEGRLRYYATRFPIVEVDSTYYAMPSARTSHLWAERTPDGFVLDVKAFRLFTGHHTQPGALPKDLRDSMPPDSSAKKSIHRKVAQGGGVGIRRSWRDFYGTTLRY